MHTIRNNQRHRFWVLVIIVSISGFSQGMLLPLISAIFEQDGISGTLNGLNATGLYIGTLLISPFMESPLRKFGYKPVIFAGGLIVILSLLSFPLWKSVVFWFFLRLLIGIGDHALHFATQTWVTSTVPTELLGRSISIYGLSVGVGFAVGPMFVPLVSIFEGLPFLLSAALTALAWGLVFTLKNDLPEIIIGTTSEGHFGKRIRAAIAVSWVALLGPFAYGFLESSLNAMFPVFALRDGIPLSIVAIIIPAFAIGGIISQVPLGILSDKIGRRSVLLIGLGGGILAFTSAAIFSNSSFVIMAMFFVGGLFCGSLFSLGVAYMSDLTPKHLLPTGNLLCGIFFSFGSLTGPILGGFVIETFHENYLYLFSILLGVLFLLTLFNKSKPESPMIQGKEL